MKFKLPIKKEKQKRKEDIVVKETTENNDFSFDDVKKEKVIDVEVTPIKKKSINPFKRIQEKQEEIKKQKEEEKRRKEEEKKKAREEKLKQAIRSYLMLVGAIMVAIIGFFAYDAGKKIRRIEFKSDQDEVFVGSYADLGYLITPASAEYDKKDITLSFSDDEMVLVDTKGYRLQKEGELKAYINYNGSVMDEKTIKVVPVLVTDIHVEDINVGVNLKKNLAVDISPESPTHKDVQYKINNPEIAKIENGEVIGVSEGTTTAVASSIDGPSCIFKINVDYIEPESIAFAGMSDTYETGRIITPKYSFQPEEVSSKEIQLLSSNEYVAEISEDGKIHTKNIGSTIITAKYSDDVSCSKEITIRYPHISNLELSSEERYVWVDYSMKINAQLHPEKVDNPDLIWTSSDEEIASVNSNGYITGKSPGYVTITAKTTTGKKAEIRIEVIQPENRYGQSNSSNSSSSGTIVGDGITVYITEYGEKYHINPSCVKHPHAVNINDAISWGYEPCEKCAQ